MSWVRLEAASVDPQLVEGLQARVADPLWMLSRQWRTGEFTGEDAADPILVSLRAESVRPRTLRWPGGADVDLAAADTPLEPLVEREAVRDGAAAARVTVELGRLLVRALARAGVPPAATARLLREFAVRLPPDDGTDPAGRRRLELLARASLDGTRLERALPADSRALDGFLASRVPDATARRTVVQVVTAWRDAAAATFAEPAGRTAWDASRLEYACVLESPTVDGGAVRLTTGDGYPGGRLAWHSFDVEPARPGNRPPQPKQPLQPPSQPAPKPQVREVELLPMPLRFAGMPAARFWELEDTTVWFGGIEAAPDDLARVAVAGYATVQGDDWYLVPFRLPVGTLTEVTRLDVLDDMGDVTSVPAAAVADGAARAFRFFELAGDPQPRRGRAPMLFLPPTVDTTEASRPVEDVAFVRDEALDVAWAVERRIESRWSGAAVDLAARTGDAAAPLPRTAPGVGAPWVLRIATPAPQTWVPLVPVTLTEDAGSAVPPGTIMFQRGRRPATGSPGATVGARGRLLEPDSRLLLHEEEIPRSGIRVVRRWQSARAPSGRLLTWLGRRKGPGRGETTSGVLFDTLDTSATDAGA